ncbi:MAG: type II toxin-antitoxin system Phd/YefM family antitoxin [Acidobacteria bacterium]|nr:type II toxin-antitoxin system Phd/YefM family antitoxin [Acidobacteriota bacterium]
MSETIGVAEAKRRFSELLDRVRGGERFVIARRGRAEVALVPPGDAAADRPERPLGFLSLAGLLSDWDDGEIEAMVHDIYASRRRAKDRPAPDLG